MLEYIGFSKHLAGKVRRASPLDENKNPQSQQRKTESYLTRYVNNFPPNLSDKRKTEKQRKGKQNQRQAVSTALKIAP